jgi:O-succinylbenzoate synthase
MNIARVIARRVKWPISSTGAAARWSSREALVIAVVDEQGCIGLGEAAPLPGMSIDVIGDAERAVAELAGREIAIETPHHASATADRVTSAPAARFAIETALLAALAQRTQTSIAQLLCAVPQGELRSAVVVGDPAEARAAALAGARCVKIKIGPGDAAGGFARVTSIAAAVPGLRLRLDANRSWPRAETLRWLAALSELPIEYVEEPCEHAHELLDCELPVRIALDESLVTLDPADLAVALESPSLGALVLKPTLLGGFARCLDLAADAHRHGVAPVTSHALEGPIGFAACVELARAIRADVPVGLARHSALTDFWRAAATGL